MVPWRQRKGLEALFPVLLAVCCGLGVVAYYGGAWVAFGDAPEYIAAAQAITQGLPYPRSGLALPFFRPPAYPAFIAILWTLFPETILTIKLAHVLLHALTCLLVFGAAELIFRKRWISLAAAAVYAVDPLALASVREIDTEVLHVFLFMSCFYCLLRSLKEETGRPVYSVAAGLLGGIASLCRPTAFPILSAIGLVLAIWRPPMRRRLVYMVLGLFAVLGPWSYLNHRATGDWILLTDATGIALWAGNHPVIVGARDSTPKKFVDFSNDGVWADMEVQRMQWDREGRYSRLSLGDRDRLWLGAAIEGMKANPIPTVRLWCIKAWGYWRPWLLPGPYSGSVVALTGAWFLTLYILCIIGLFSLGRSPEERLFWHFFITTSLASTVVHAVFYASVRYRFPYFDPFAVMLALSGVFRIRRMGCSWLSR